jgi:PAS domain S-box-containing protein
MISSSSEKTSPPRRDRPLPTGLVCNPPLMVSKPPLLHIDFTPVPPYVPLTVRGDLQAVLRYATGEVIGNMQFLINAVHPDDLRQLISGLYHLFLRGYHVYEYRLLRKGRSYVRMFLELQLVRNQRGVPLKICCSIREPFFSIEGLLTPCSGETPSLGELLEGEVDYLYRIRSISPSVAKFLGYKHADIVGNDVRELVPHDYRAAANMSLVRVMECCQDKAYLWTAVRHRNGSLRFVACEIRGGFDEKKNRILAIRCHDICRLICNVKKAECPSKAGHPFGKGETKVHGEADPINSLTSRELDILYLTVEGYSSKEVGNHLSISPRTVEAHRVRVMKKLRVRSIPELIRVTVCRLAYPSEA